MKISKNKLRLIMLIFIFGGMRGKYATQDKYGFVTAHGVMPVRDSEGWTSFDRLRVICHSDNSEGWHNTLLSRKQYNRSIRKLVDSRELTLNAETLD